MAARTGSDYGSSSTKSNARLLDALLWQMQNAKAKFADAQKILATKIIDDKAYNITPHTNSYIFNFDEAIKKIQKRIKEAKEEAASHSNPRRRAMILEHELHGVCKSLGLIKENGKPVVSANKLRAEVFHVNEIISFFIRFNADYSNWIGRKPEERVARQTAWNSMQTAKSKEKCLSATLGCMMMHLATGSKELHAGLLLMLNDTGHQSQITKTLDFVTTVLGTVPVTLNKETCRLDHYETQIRDVLGAEEAKEDDDSDEELHDVLSQKVYRRSKGRVTQWIVKLAKACQSKGAYLYVAMDETQNATGTNGVYHTLVNVIMDKDAAPSVPSDDLDDEAKAILRDIEDEKFRKLIHNHYFRACYWTATPFQHNATKAIRTIGVVGLNHTGIHCIEGVYCKNVAGQYMNETDELQPEMHVLEDLQDELGYTAGSVIPVYYDREQSFNRWRRKAALEGLIPSAAMTHDQYRENCHEQWAALLEHVAANNPKQTDIEYAFPDMPAMIAARISRNNGIIEDTLIPGIISHLKDPDKFHIVAYNLRTRTKEDFKSKKSFDLKDFIKTTISKTPAIAGKTLVVVFTAKGRCGDQFPPDFRTFIEVPGMNNRDITVLAQAMYGRSCGYNKGTPWVILPERQCDIIETYINNDGHVTGDMKAKGAKTHEFKSRQYFGIEYELQDGKAVAVNTDPELLRILKKIQKACPKISSLATDKKGFQGMGKGGRIEKAIPTGLVQEVVALLQKRGQPLASLDEVGHGFSTFKTKNRVKRHAYLKPASVLGPTVGFLARGYRLTDTGETDSSGGRISGSPTGQHIADHVFQPTLVWFDHKGADGLYRKELVGINLLCRGMYWRNEPHAPFDSDIENIPTSRDHISARLDFNNCWSKQSCTIGDAKKSVMPIIDGSADSEEE
jgi:hypothetical protein